MVWRVLDGPAKGGSQGFALTVVLSFRDKTLVGFASNDKEWHPVRGTFEVVK